MHDLAFMAATEWAKAQAGNHHDPCEFGQRVAQVEFFCLHELEKLAKFSAGDAPADAAHKILKSAGFSAQVNADGRVSGFGPPATPEQRASAMDFAGWFAPRVRNGAVIECASALANRLAAGRDFELAATLVFRNGQCSPEAPLASWADLIKAIDAVAAWLKTGEWPADPSVLAQVFPPAAGDS